MKFDGETPARALVRTIFAFNEANEKWLKLCFDESKQEEAEQQQQIMDECIAYLDRSGWDATQVSDLFEKGLFIVPKKDWEF